MRHQVVQRFVESGADLGTILAEQQDRSSDPVLAALGQLLSFIRGEHATKEAFVAACALDGRDTDPDLEVVFLCTWAQASLQQSGSAGTDESEAKAIVHRARALLHPGMPREVRAFQHLAESRLAGYVANHVVQEALIREALALLPTRSARRPEFTFELALLLARTGRLAELAEDDPNWAKDGLPERAVSRLRAIDHIETGRLERARGIVFEPHTNSEARFPVDTAEEYRALLALMGGDLEAGATSDPAFVLQCLLTGRFEQALRWARLCARKQRTPALGLGISSYNLIRCELAQVNWEAAHRLLELRQQAGNRSYMDGFFLARVYRLAGASDLATEQFAATLAAVDRHHAEGRLDFELGLAPEIPRSALVRLTRRAERQHMLSKKRPGTDVPGDETRPQDAGSGRARLIGISPGIGAVREAIVHMAPLDVPVLITGETGTGKELVAHALHKTGPRAGHPFVAVNCGAITESLLESELFGHAKGAFSSAASEHKGFFEEAADGTVFLDEIGDIPPKLQVALLRVLETNEIRRVGSPGSQLIRCRILAATNANLRGKAEQGLFRLDLLYRFERLQIHIPSLRERPDDIIPLARHFLNTDRASGMHAVISAALAAALRDKDWPGNVRELRNAIERMRLMNSDKLHYDTNDLAEPRAPTVPPNSGPRTRAPGTKRPADMPGAPPPPPSEPVLLPTPVAGATSPVRRLEQLRRLFQQHGLLTRAEVMAMLDVSGNTATRYLKTLCEQQIIERRSPSRSPRSVYFQLRSTAASGSRGL